MSQIPAFTFYIVENNDGHMANMEMNGTIYLDGNTILADMGKTVVQNGFVFRKVQIVTDDNGNQVFGGTTGYICLNSDRILGDNQGVSKLN